MKSIKSLLIKLGIFSIPIIIFFSPVVITGEHFNSGEVAWEQQRDNRSIIYGPIAEGRFRFYKAESSRLYKPSVLILGDSRAIQIRDFFFNDDIRTYNAGHSVTHAADMLHFLDSQDVSAIDTLIIVISPFSFNANSTTVRYPTHTNFIIDTTRLSAIDQFTFFYNTLFSGNNIFIPNLLNPDIIGQNAKSNISGTLNDGSFYYGRELLDKKAGETAAERMVNTLERIDSADKWDFFAHGLNANPKAIDYLEKLLQFCTDNDIFVIAYVPPYAPTINDVMRSKGNAYAYHIEMLNMVPSVFKRYNFEFYDYTDVSHLGCTDEHFLDGHHPSDVVLLRMFIDMIEKGSRLSEYCTLVDLYEYDRNRFSDIGILETWEQYNEITLNRLLNR